MKAEIEVTDCRDCPYAKDHRGHGECWKECQHPQHNQGGYENILWGCGAQFKSTPDWCPLKARSIKTYVPLVPDHRLVEVIRGYISNRSTDAIRPDLNNEHRLLELARLITDECQTRIPLWELERAYESKRSA